MTQEPAVRSITELDMEGFRAAVDTVAREKLYLSRHEGPSLEGARQFVQNNIANGYPQFVAVNDVSVVGWCDIVRSSGDYESHVGSLGMGVLEEWRGKGLGRRLLLAALAGAREIGLTRIALSVHASNARAIHLYRSLGFREEGRLVRARLIDARYEDVILMAKLDGSTAP